MSETKYAQAKNGMPEPTALAEQGKIHAVGGQHNLALVYYRAAMQQTRGADAESKLLSRYFAECALESFERMGDHDSVLDYCERSLSHYEQHPPEGVVAAKDSASIHQRKAITLLKLGETKAAENFFGKAIHISQSHQLSLPISETFLKWIHSAFHFDNRRLEQQLEQKSYYTISRNTIDHSRAAALPAHILDSLQPHLA